MPPAFFVSGAGTTFGLSDFLTSLPGEGPSAAVKEVEMEIVPDGAKEQEKQDCCSNSAQYHEDLHHIYEEEGRLLFRVLLLFRSLPEALFQIVGIKQAVVAEPARAAFFP